MKKLLLLFLILPLLLSAQIGIEDYEQFLKLPTANATTLGFLNQNGTVPLTANWDVGAFNLTASRFISGLGAAATPAFGEAGGSGMSFSAAGGSVLLSVAGTNRYTFTANTATVPTSLVLLSAGTTIRRHADYEFQFGVDASTAPASQTLKGPDSTGTNGIGGYMNLNGGKSTGTGLGGRVVFSTTPASAVSSDTENSYVERMAIKSDGEVDVGSSGFDGVFGVVGTRTQKTLIRLATVEVTTTAAATATATNLIPAGSFVLGVSTRVTTAVTGDAGFTGIDIGNGTDADMFGANVSPSLNATTTLANSTITAPVIYAAATSIVLTQVGGTTFVAGGKVRIVVHYISLTAPAT